MRWSRAALHPQRSCARPGVDQKAAGARGRVVGCAGSGGWVAVGGGGAACITGGVAMAGNCCVGGCAGGAGGDGAGLLRGADRWLETTSSTSRGGCLVASVDFTSIIAFGSSHRA